MMDTFRIGTKYFNYNTLRNFASTDLEGVRYRKVADISKLIEYPIYKLFNRVPLSLHNIFIDHGIKGVDFFHFFNTVYFGKKNWFVTAEDLLPRISFKSKYFVHLLLEKLMQPNCKRILFMSNNAYVRQINYLLEQHPEFIGLKNKSVVLYPPQSVFLSDVSAKQINTDCLRFIFIGRHFYRKGGLELLRAVDRLSKEGLPFRLTIISSLTNDHWCTEHIGKNEILEAKSILYSNRNSITHHFTLDNRYVLEAIRNSDIGILPSYGETFGYSVMECQAWGVPVISTDTWALNEINNNETGWLLHVPKRKSYSGWVVDASGENEMRQISVLLEEEIFQNMKKIILDPALIRMKAIAGIENLRQRHDPSVFATQLKSIYNSTN